MQLHNTENTGQGDCPDAIWELIPWYVNESLPSDQAQIVERHSESCAACAAEIGRQRRLAKEVVKIDPFEAPLSQSWDSLRAQIESESRAKTPKAGAWHRFGGMRGGLLALASAACIAVFVVVSLPADNDFQTLTSQNPDAAQMIRFQTSPGLDADTLNDILAQYGATLVSGPSAAGVYIAVVGTDADTKAAADALMATTQIIFAAPQVDQ